MVDKSIKGTSWRLPAGKYRPIFSNKQTTVQIEVDVEAADLEALVNKTDTLLYVFYHLISNVALKTNFQLQRNIQSFKSEM